MLGSKKAVLILKLNPINLFKRRINLKIPKREVDFLSKSFSDSAVPKSKLAKPRNNKKWKRNRKSQA